MEEMKRRIKVGREDKFPNEWESESDQGARSLCREKHGGRQAEVLGEGRRGGPIFTKLGWKPTFTELCEAD